MINISHKQQSRLPKIGLHTVQLDNMILYFNESNIKITEKETEGDILQRNSTTELSATNLSTVKAQSAN